MRQWRFAVFVVALARCSVIVDGAIRDRGTGDSCAMFPDGTACAVMGIIEPMVCNDGSCELSSCGDGVVDRRTEMCDDENDVSGDGCEPLTCVPSCTDPSACDDLQACNGAEACTEGRCVEGSEAPDGTPCSDGPISGMCMDGTCVPAGCGDGMVMPPEECDPGVAGTVGCQTDCTWVCETDEECAAMDTNVCDGADTCMVALHQCIPGIPLVCGEDANPCTIEGCDPSTGCFVDTTTNDADGDLFYAESCGGDDCDDTRSEVNPRQSDICGDGLDNDCNDIVDDGIPTWYVDCDGDDFAASTSGSIQSCDRPTSAPPGCGSDGTGTWISMAPGATTTDCADLVRNARPGQTAFFTTGYFDPGGSVSFDYDCDGRPAFEYMYLPAGSTPGPCTGGFGTCSGPIYYVDRPFCGEANTLTYCAGTALTCTRRTAPTTVACR
jgi:cysteine-rich repeat protein